MNQNEYVSAKGNVYRAETGTGFCDGCAFQPKSACPPDKKVKGPACMPSWRQDGRHIIWLRQKKSK